MVLILVNLRLRISDMISVNHCILTLETTITSLLTVILTHFNSEINETAIHDFCSIYNFCNLCDKATCCKNPENPSCIDLFLTYFPRCLQNILAIETVLCDFHRLVVIVLKIYLPNDQIITYRNYKHLDNKGFLKEFLWEFDSLGSLAKNAEMFQNLSIVFLDKYAPEKQKYVRANQATFKDTEFNHAIIVC